jgi:hypothetical protein
MQAIDPGLRLGSREIPIRDIRQKILKCKYDAHIIAVYIIFLNDPLHAAARAFYCSRHQVNLDQAWVKVVSMALNPKILFTSNGQMGPRSGLSPGTEERFETRMLISASPRLQTGLRNLSGLFPPMYFFLLGNAHI